MSDEREVKSAKPEADEPGVEEPEVEAHYKSARNADEAAEADDVEAHVKSAKT
jgi:hypothetical protein